MTTTTTAPADDPAVVLINFQCPHCGHFWAGPWPAGDLALLPKKVQRGGPLPVPCSKPACRGQHRAGRQAAARPTGGAR